MKAETHLRLPRQAPDVGAATRVQLKQKAAASFSLRAFLSFLSFLFRFFSCSFSQMINDEKMINDK
jgi:hypothetical protein